MMNTMIDYCYLYPSKPDEKGKRGARNAWVFPWMKVAFNGESPIQIRTAGGSIPIAPFVTTLDIPAVSVPTVQKDNNQHSPNENIRMGNYFDGIKTIIAVLSQEL